MSDDLVLRSEADVGRHASRIWESSLRPTSAKSARDVGIILMAGRDANLTMTQTLQNVMIVNGRPSIWGDAMWALVLAHPEFAGKSEKVVGNGDDRVYEVTLYRKKRIFDEVVTIEETGRFGVEHAKCANLWGKAGPWRSYPDRMLKIRARAFAARDLFSDAIGGMGIVEEQQDVPQSSVVEVQSPIDAVELLPDATPENSDIGDAELTADQQQFLRSFEEAE